ncbi:MAG: ABC transporter permease [Oscillospiraceae bacterium]|nr:ABC transporter permease [Oscillospiraceae bacterium]
MKQTTIRKLVSLGLLLIFALIFGFTTDYFFTWKNITTLLREVSIIGLLAMGGAFVIIGGGIDLSTGAVLGLSAMIASRLVTDTMLPIFVIVLICVLAGAVAGVINGLLVARFGMSEFIGTFATAFIYRAFVYMLAYRTNGHITTKTVTDAAFRSLGGNIGGVYYMTIVWALLILVTWFVLRHTRYGTYVYAMGSNRKSAEFTGINVDKMKVSTFVISSCFSALAGVFLVAWQGSANLSSGEGMNFQAIAAAVVGGIALTGGRGDTVGVAIGSCFLVMVVNGLYKYGLPTHMQPIFYGVVIIVMAIFDAIYIRTISKRNIASKKIASTKGGAA